MQQLVIWGPAHVAFAPTAEPKAGQDLPTAGVRQELVTGD